MQVLGSERNYNKESTIEVIDQGAVERMSRTWFELRYVPSDDWLIELTNEEKELITTELGKACDAIAKMLGIERVKH